MATATSWSSRIRHDSDAVYQEWRDEVITKLAILVAGGYLTADETNITAGAGARPGTNTEGGYAVYHLNDSLHGTAPVYIRFGFGTGGSATNPRIQVTTGTATNGTGTLSGTALSTIQSIMNTTGQTSDTARASYACALPGYFGFAWKTGTTTASPNGAFFINRTCDNTGAITATGSQAVWGAGTDSAMGKTQAFRYASTAAAYTAQTALEKTALGISPQGPTTSLTGGNIQVMMGWTITPTVGPLFGLCGAIIGDVADGATFTVALVGSTSRTYVALTICCGCFSAAPNNVANGVKYCMLYE